MKSIIKTFLLCFALNSVQSKNIFGNVKMPNEPIEIDYPVHEQHSKTYKIMVSSLFTASEKKVMESLAIDLSKTRLKDS